MTEAGFVRFHKLKLYLVRYSSKTNSIEVPIIFIRKHEMLPQLIDYWIPLILLTLRASDWQTIWNFSQISHSVPLRLP